MIRSRARAFGTAIENVELYAKAATAMLLGALIGLEREWARSGEKRPLFAGIRTFPLIALFGCLSALASEHAPWAFAASTVIFGALVVASAYLTSGEDEGKGTTTEVTSFLAFLLGALVFWGYLELAAAAAVVVTFVLALKHQLHDLADRMEAEDIHATLKFGIVAIVILPLLPWNTYGPWLAEGMGFAGDGDAARILDTLNPRKIWLFVVLISGISFTAYGAIKFLGTSRGVFLTGLLGGMVSSTAVTISFAHRSRTKPGLSSRFALAIVVAVAAIFPRTFLEIFIVNRGLAVTLVLPLLVLFLGGVGASLLLWRRARPESVEDVEFENPFHLAPAIQFGLLISGVLVVSKAAEVLVGGEAVYAVAALTGMANMSAVALAMANQATGPEAGIALTTGAIAVILGSTTSVVFKGGLIWFVGDEKLRRYVLPLFGPFLVVALAVIAGMLLWG